VATVTGQTLSGMLVDRSGLGSMAPKPITLLRVVGAVLAVIAVFVAVSPEVGGAVDWWVLVLPLAAGLGLGWQQAVNGQLKEISRSALTATFFNFLVGATVLAVVFAVHAVVRSAPVTPPGNPLLYVGGVIGIVFVAGYAIVVRYTGVLVMGLAAVAGQLVASLGFDLLLPVADRPLHWTTVAGTAGTLLAVAIAAIPAAPSAPRRDRPRADPV
jgi:bacterial/archaeal transporter family-2 protein